MSFVMVVSLVLWLCSVSVHVAAVVAIGLVCSIILMFISAISSYASHRKFLRDLASCQCPQCHQAFGLGPASRAEQQAEAKSEFERDQEEFEEWPIECPNCKYVSYFVPDTTIYSRAWSDRTETQL
jgi:hypothetical protein